MQTIFGLDAANGDGAFAPFYARLSRIRSLRATYELGRALRVPAKDYARNLEYAIS
jgi:hypothetical protein